MFTRKKLVSVLLTACGCLLVPVFLAACGMSFKSLEPNYFRRNELRENLAGGNLKVPAAAIADDGVKSSPRLPCRIAVYLKPGGVDGEWTPGDREAVAAWGASLKKDGFATAVFPLSVDPNGQKDVTALEHAAAEQGADVFFFVRGMVETDSYLNFAAPLNLTVVGGFIVPASHRDALVVIQGSLIDVTDSHIYATVQTEGLARIIRPLAFIDEKVATERAKKKAMTAFGDELLKQMRTLAGTNANPNATGISVPPRGQP